MKKNKTAKALTLTVFYVICILAAILALLPLIWTISTSLKPKVDAFTFPPSFIPKTITFDNFVETWGMAPFGRFILNTVFVTVTSVAGQLLFSSLAAYAFARLKFPGRDAIFMCYLGSMMIPGVVVLIPTFIMVKNLNWIDTYYALIVPHLFGSAFGTFLLRQFFITIPESLVDAAKIDGCSHLRIYSQIVIPMSKNIFTTLGVITFINSWNNFLWSLIVTNREEMKLLSVGIATTFQSLYSTQWTNLMAASTIALLPLIVLFLFAQRYFVESIQLTGFK